MLLCPMSNSRRMSDDSGNELAEYWLKDKSYEMCASLGFFILIALQSAMYGTRWNFYLSVDGVEKYI